MSWNINLHYQVHVLAILLMAAASCRGGDGTSDTDTTGGETNGDGSLDVCRALPEAELANWREGPDVPATGASTSGRMAIAGDQTWALALDLLRGTDPGEHPSIAHGPTSMTLALGLSYDRWPTACGETLPAAIHAQEAGDALHQTLGASLRELEGRSLPAGADGEDPVVVSLRPSLWELNGAPPAAGNAIYGATSHSVIDPQTSEELDAIRTVMNCVIEQQSRGLLIDFIPDDVPGTDTTAFDVNVAFLQAPWAIALSAWGTMPFTRDDGVQVGQAMMGEQGLWTRYYGDDTLEALDVPLRGGALSVLFVRPRASAFASLTDFVLALTPEQLRAARDDGEDTQVAQFLMPKFTVDSETIDYFDPLGLVCELFTLRKVLHGATVEFDEKGIKAAAATANESWDSGGVSPGELYFTLDRPFLFFVHDAATRFVLYSGRYAGP